MSRCTIYTDFRHSWKYIKHPLNWSSVERRCLACGAFEIYSPVGWLAAGDRKKLADDMTEAFFSEIKSKDSMRA